MQRSTCRQAIQWPGLALRGGGGEEKGDVGEWRDGIEKVEEHRGMGNGRQQMERMKGMAKMEELT